MYQFRSNEPIYLQLIELIRQSIVSGEYPEGSRCPTVRELAGKYGINPGTVQKSLNILEEQGLLKAENTSGRFITLTDGQREAIRKSSAEEATQSYYQKMRELGYSGPQVCQIIAEIASKEEEHA